MDDTFAIDTALMDTVVGTRATTGELTLGLGLDDVERLRVKEEVFF